MEHLIFQAGDFLLSSKGHPVNEDRELDENAYLNNDYSDTASLLELVII